ncbi:hypothetical protein [Anoxybacillus sp. B7M1]|uniref:hypothetical protein n=1 Tax=Anoxybacillaceae TaxID=3120669 RepID=UPI0005CCAC24|nr:hypothetical protein [Anoxybacillus sp. B7M1]OQM44585.1 hypothetical protein B6A27_15780 [Anoxybacillus sp. UARK-01]
MQEKHDFVQNIHIYKNAEGCGKSKAKGKATDFFLRYVTITWQQAKQRRLQPHSWIYKRLVIQRPNH